MQGVSSVEGTLFLPCKYNFLEGIEMRHKLLIMVLAVTAVFSCAAAISACGEGDRHEHTYSAEWSFDETNHWHAATCEHTDVIADKEAHVFENDVCSKCGYSSVSVGLSYRLGADGQSYSVVGRGKCLDANIIIPSVYNDLPVTEIGERAFEDTSVSSVTLPETITSIGGAAFFDCDRLTGINIPAGVQSIGASAFKGCSSLKSIALPDIPAIGNFTFSGCASLAEITIPQSVASIGSSAFEGCESFKNITIPENVASIGDSAFYNCGSLQSVTIGKGVESIQSWAFRNCGSLTSFIYSGTKEQWNAIEKDFMWDRDTPPYTVRCTDGDIAKG